MTAREPIRCPHCGTDLSQVGIEDAATHVFGCSSQTVREVAADLGRAPSAKCPRCHDTGLVDVYVPGSTLGHGAHIRSEVCICRFDWRLGC